MCHIIIDIIATSLTTFKHAVRMLSLNCIQQRHELQFSAVIMVQSTISLAGRPTSRSSHCTRAHSYWLGAALE